MTLAQTQEKKLPSAWRPSFISSQTGLMIVVHASWNSAAMAFQATRMVP